MRTAVLALLLIAGAPALAGEPPDTLETRMAAAQRYAAAANMPKMLDDSFKAASMNLPEADREKFLALTKKYVKTESLEAMTITAMVKHFTTKELDALANFYGSPEGQSAMAKLGTYMAEVMPQVQAEMLRAVQEMQKELQAEQAKTPGGT